MSEENAEQVDQLDAEIETAITTQEEPPKEEESAPPEEPEPTETEESQANDAEDDEPEKTDGVQKRFNKLTARYYTEKEKREKLEKELEEARRQIKPVREDEPKLADFGYDEESYNKAVREYDKKEIIRELKNEQSYSSEMKKASEILDQHEQRVLEFGKDDYYDVVGPLIQSNTIIGKPLEVLLGDEKSAQMQYHLGQNPKLAEKIGRMGEAHGIAEIAKLSVKLSTVKPVKTTKAPDPVKTASSGGAKADVKIEEKSMDEIMADESI